MKKGIQKIIASALVLMMILAMVPTFAFAEGDANPAGDSELSGDANINNESGNSENNSDPSAQPDGPKGPGISGTDEEGNSTMTNMDNYGISAPDASAFSLGDLIPGLGDEGSDVPMIGYSKFVYIVGADLGEGAETWAKINVVKEYVDAEGNTVRKQLAHGAFPVGLSLINDMTVSLTPYAREHYTIKDIESEHAISKVVVLEENMANFTYYTMHTSFTHTLTIVLDGGPAEEPDVPDTPDNELHLLYFSEGKAVDSDAQPADKDGNASFVLKTLTREGYTLKGLLHGADLMQPGETLVTDHDDIVTAIWEKNGGEDPDPDQPTPPPAGDDEFTLSFDANGGKDAPKAKKYDEGTVVSLDLDGRPVPTHDAIDEANVLFMGWTKDNAYPVLKAGDKLVLADHLITMKSDRTVYALWGLDVNDNKIPDVVEPRLNLYYNLSKQGVEGTGPATRSDILIGQQVELDYTTVPEALKENVMFLYWTDAKNAIKYDVANHTFGDNFTKEELPDKLTSIQMLFDTAVYAVWGYDNNGDGIPDVSQDFVDLKYNPASGTGGPGTEKVALGSTVTLKNEPKPTHEAIDDVPVLFVGWTGELDEKQVYDKDDVLPANMISTLTVPNDSKGEEVFAIYGYDRNGNNVPDVTELTLTYDANGGKGGPGEVLVEAQMNYVLETEDLPTHGKQLSYDVLFYGWSLSKHPLPLTYLDSSNKPVDMVAKVDIFSDTTVYAVWALDTNGNKIPDVDEDTLTLSFDVNGGVELTRPLDEKHLAGETVGLKHTLLVQHEDVEEVPVAIIGWTEEIYEDIFDKKDTLPAYSRESIIMPETDTTLYALWGYDRNGDGIPDAIQTLVELTYDPMDGKGGPGTVEVDDGSLQILEKKNVPTHDDVNGYPVLHYGWTMTPDEHVYAVGEEKPETEKLIKISGDTTVYAVYAFDEDGNGVPDIDEYEKVFTLHFDPNGGLTAPADQKAYSKNGKDAYINITSELPTHEKDTFKGWAIEPDGKPMFRPGQRVKLESDVTLYAVWGDKGGGVPGGGGIPGFGGGAGGGKGNPKTGDESNAALWAVLAGLSVMGMGVTAVAVKKHRKEN